MQGTVPATHIPIKQWAERKSYKLPTVYSWYYKGRLPAVKINGCIYVEATAQQLPPKPTPRLQPHWRAWKHRRYTQFTREEREREFKRLFPSLNGLESI